jgi:hypothetical protein
VGVAEKPQALERGLSAFAAAVAFSGPTPCCCYRKNMLAGSHVFSGRGRPEKARETLSAVSPVW